MEGVKEDHNASLTLTQSVQDRYNGIVTHPDNYPAQLDLTSVVKGEPVFSFRKAVLMKERLDAYKESSHLVKGSSSGE